MAVLSCVPGQPWLGTAMFVLKTTKTLESSIAESENPRFREFLEALGRYNLITTSCWSHENDVLLFSGNIQRFSPFERGTTLGWSPSSLCSHWRRALSFCLRSTTSLLVQPPNHCGGRAPHLRNPQIPAPLVRPLCNCLDSPGGRTGRPCPPGPVQVVHRYPWK